MKSETATLILAGELHGCGYLSALPCSSIRLQPSILIENYGLSLKSPVSVIVVGQEM